MVVQDDIGRQRERQDTVVPLLDAFPDSPLTRAALSNEGTAVVMDQDERDYAAVMKMLNAGECTAEQANELLVGNRYALLRLEAEREEDRILARVAARPPSSVQSEDSVVADSMGENRPAYKGMKRGGKPLAAGQWSRKYDACRRCHSTDRPHSGHGFCMRCSPHKDAFLAELEAQAAAAHAVTAIPQEFETRAGDYRLTSEDLLLLKTAHETWRPLNIDSLSDMQRLALDLPRIIREVQDRVQGVDLPKAPRITVGR